MSILKYFSEYSKEYQPPSVKWRERRVWHKTKSNDMHFVKIKSLSPEEQMKYKPIDLIHKGQRAEKLNKKIKAQKEFQSTGTELPLAEPKARVEGEVFDFYYGVKDPDKYKDIEEDELVEATLDSSKAVDMEDDEGLHIVFAKNVPVDAVKEYLDSEGDWKEIEIKDKDKKAEFIKFSENDYFKLDLFKYKDIIELELQTEEEEDVKENVKSYEHYLNLLSKNNMTNLVNEDTVDPKIKEIANQVGKKLGLELRGFADIDLVAFPELKKFQNHANYHDPITKSLLVIDIVNDFITSLKIGWENLKDERLKFGFTEPPKPSEIQENNNIKDYDKYLNGKIEEDKSLKITESTDNTIEYNWYIDKKLLLL